MGLSDCSDMDTGDSKSSELINSLSAVIDIDKMFADFNQSENKDNQHQQISTFSGPGVSGFTATSSWQAGLPGGSGSVGVGLKSCTTNRIHASHDANGNKLVINTTTTTSTTSRKVIIPLKPTGSGISGVTDPPGGINRNDDNNNNSGAAAATTTSDVSMRQQHKLVMCRKLTTAL